MMERQVDASLTYRNVRWLFLANALINWIVSLPGIFNPRQQQLPSAALNRTTHP
jgi:hypothetical protein